MDIDTLSKSLEGLKNKKEYFEVLVHNLGLSAVIVAILAGILGAARFYYNFKKDNINKEITTINDEIKSFEKTQIKKKEEEFQSQIDNITNTLVLLNAKLYSTQSTINNPNSYFEKILQEDFNLTKEKLNAILDKQIGQNENLLNKAISLNILGKTDDALQVFKDVIFISNDNYQLALSNSFVGSIYLHLIIDKKENPKDYLEKAAKLFNKLPSNNHESIAIRKYENYNDLGIYFKRSDEFKLSKTNYEKALSIVEKLNGSYPNKYNLEIGMEYHNLYILLNSEKKPNAIDYLIKAYDYKKLAIRNDQYTKAVFLNTTNTLINHYFLENFVDKDKANNYFNESEYIIDEVFKNEKDLNGVFIESAANIYANYGFHLKRTSKNQLDYENGISLMLKSLNFFKTLKENNYIVSRVIYSNLLHNLGVEFNFEGFNFEFCNNNLLEAISIREQLAFSIPGKQYEVALADSYLVISKLYYKYKKSEFLDYAKKAKVLYSKYVSEDNSLNQYLIQAAHLVN